MLGDDLHLCQDWHNRERAFDHRRLRSLSKLARIAIRIKVRISFGSQVPGQKRNVLFRLFVGTRWMGNKVMLPVVRQWIQHDRYQRIAIITRSYIPDRVADIPGQDKNIITIIREDHRRILDLIILENECPSSYFCRWRYTNCRPMGTGKGYPDILLFVYELLFCPIGR